MGLPPALTFQQFNFPPDKDTADVTFTVKPNADPGTYTVILRGQVQVNKADPKTKKQTNLTVLLPSTPITLTVLPKELAKLSVAGSPKVKVGGETEVVVRVARRHNFAGPFEVKLIVPAGVKGLEPAEATVPAGANEVRLAICADPGYDRGHAKNLVVRAVGLFQGKVATTQEMKLSVNVVK